VLKILHQWRLSWPRQWKEENGGKYKVFSRCNHLYHDDALNFMKLFMLPNNILFLSMVTILQWNPCNF
jgi:hypothetical protein